jgi:hypothetical protein
MGIISYLKSVHADLVTSPGSSGYSNGTDERRKSISGQPKTRILIIVLLLAGLSAHATDRQTALDVYVRAADSHYHYPVLEKKRVPGCRDYLIRMTSQQWLSPAQVNHSLWEHWLRIYVPDTVSSTTGLLYIRGGSISDPRPGTNHDLETLAILRVCGWHALGIWASKLIWPHSNHDAANIYELACG